MNIGWVFVHGWTGDSCRTFVRIKFLRLVLAVLMLASMSLTVHFIEASQYWAEAGRAGQGEEGGYGKPKHNIR